MLRLEPSAKRPRGRPKRFMGVVKGDLRVEGEKKENAEDMVGREQIRLERQPLEGATKRHRKSSCLLMNSSQVLTGQESLYFCKKQKNKTKAQ